MRKREYFFYFKYIHSQNHNHQLSFSLFNYTFVKENSRPYPHMQLKPLLY